MSQEDLFYLEIPTAIVSTVCLRPRKYLRYLGWCVLGVIGDVSDEQGNVVELDGELVDRGVYHYIVPDQNVLAHAIDLEVIKQRSQVSPKTSTRTLRDFSAKLLEHDGIWPVCTGLGYISSHTNEAMRHVHVTLALVCELNSVLYCIAPVAPILMYC